MANLFRRIFPPPLSNTGSLARDLLASERTFLAWTRTGLTFIALGVALEKVEALAILSPTLLHLADSRTKLAAGILVGTGTLTVGHGTFSYYRSVKLLREGKVRVNVGGVGLLAVTSIGLAIAGAGMVMGDGERTLAEAKEEGKKGR